MNLTYNYITSFICLFTEKSLNHWASIDVLQLYYKHFKSFKCQFGGQVSFLTLNRVFIKSILIYSNLAMPLKKVSILQSEKARKSLKIYQFYIATQVKIWYLQILDLCILPFRVTGQATVEPYRHQIPSIVGRKSIAGVLGVINLVSGP